LAGKNRFGETRNILWNMKSLIRFLSFEAVLFALLFLPPYLMDVLWWPDPRVTMAVVLSCVGYGISGPPDRALGHRWAVFVGISAVPFSWYRMVLSYESSLNLLVWFFPTLLLYFSIAGVAVLILRRMTAYRAKREREPH
jgi:hypothetical protein